MMIAAENNWGPSVLVGALLVIFGLLWMRSHLRNWRLAKDDSTLDDFDIRHMVNRFQRRMQTSGMLVLIGILIPVGDIFILDWGLWSWSVYWLGVLILALWVGVQALGDLTAIQSYSRVTAARCASRRQEIEAELAEIRRTEGNKSD
ncbi:MAG: hypothetical protein VB858_03120 [Planctomycetaceae bacterium]